jgi:hypothetical protein
MRNARVRMIAVFATLATFLLSSGAGFSVK